jgi:hypothetical protein
MSISQITKETDYQMIREIAKTKHNEKIAIVIFHLTIGIFRYYSGPKAFHTFVSSLGLLFGTGLGIAQLLHITRQVKTTPGQLTKGFIIVPVVSALAGALIALSLSIITIEVPYKLEEMALSYLF